MLGSIPFGCSLHRAKGAFTQGKATSRWPGKKCIYSNVVLGTVCKESVLPHQQRSSLLSYDAAVFQWITSCHKNRMTTRVITLVGIRNVIDDVRNNNVNFHWKCVHFKSDKTYFRSHMIKRILHSWSFYMKFIKLAQGSFNKFHMK